eukprot:1141268-Pelagomonas_calceolata.AAC.1
MASNSHPYHPGLCLFISVTARTEARNAHTRKDGNPLDHKARGAMPGAVGLSTCIDKSKRPSSIRFHRRPTLEKHRTIGSHVNPLY